MCHIDSRSALLLHPSCRLFISENLKCILKTSFITIAGLLEDDSVRAVCSVNTSKDAPVQMLSRESALQVAARRLDNDLDRSTPFRSHFRLRLVQDDSSMRMTQAVRVVFTHCDKCIANNRMRLAITGSGGAM